MNANYINRKLLESGKSPGTLNEYLTRFRALIRWGYKNDLIEDIRFLDKLDNFKDRTHKEKIQDKYLEEPEVRLLLSRMDHQIWKFFAQLMILSGLPHFLFARKKAKPSKSLDFKGFVRLRFLFGFIGFQIFCLQFAHRFLTHHNITTAISRGLSFRDEPPVQIWCTFQICRVTPAHYLTHQLCV